MTKKRADGDGGRPERRRAAAKQGGAAKKGTATKAGDRSAMGAATAAGPAKKRAAPRIRASHGGSPEAPRGAPERRGTASGALRAKPAPRKAALGKTALAAPKRAGARRSVPAPAQPAAEARELALSLAAVGLDKKAIGIEILEVVGRVDYADYLVIMTGRSDRHVHAIATGIEEEMRRQRHAPLSIEGLSSATWVLIDFGDVVVHVFQEETRRLYDIEGLWIDAGRVAVPAAPAGDRAAPPSGAPTVTRVLT